MLFMLEMSIKYFNAHCFGLIFDILASNQAIKRQEFRKANEFIRFINLIRYLFSDNQKGEADLLIDCLMNDEEFFLIEFEILVLFAMKQERVARGDWLCLEMYG